MNLKRIAIVFLFLITPLVASAESELYPKPAQWSLGDLVDWAMPKIRIATDTLPPIASATLGDVVILTNPAGNTMGAYKWQLWLAAPSNGGDLSSWTWSMVFSPYTHSHRPATDVVGWPQDILWNLGKVLSLQNVDEFGNASYAWITPAAGGGTSTHSALLGLGYGESGHTDFAGRSDALQPMPEAGWEDAGRVWNDSDLAQLDGVDNGIVDIKAIGGNRVLVLPWGVGHSKIFLSRDGGSHWNEVESPALLSTNDRTANALANLGCGCLLVGFGSVETATESNRFARSEDFGETWSLTSGGIPADLNVYSLEYIGRGETLACAQGVDTDVSIWATTNKGDAWSQVATMAQWLGLYEMTFVGSDTIIGETMIGEIMRSVDRGRTWVSVETPNDEYFDNKGRITFSDGIAFATRNNSSIDRIQVLRSTDRGSTWSVVFETPDYFDISNVCPIGGSSYLAAVVNLSMLAPSILRSDDFGLTWHPVGSELTDIYGFGLLYGPTAPLHLVNIGNGQIFTADDWCRGWSYQFNAPAAASGGGETAHADLTGLGFEESGHIGFASEAAIPSNASFTLAGLSSKRYWDLTDRPSFGTMASESAADFMRNTGPATHPYSLDVATLTVNGVNVLGDISTALSEIIGE